MKSEQETGGFLIARRRTKGATSGDETKGRRFVCRAHRRTFLGRLESSPRLGGGGGAVRRGRVQGGLCPLICFLGSKA